MGDVEEISCDLVVVGAGPAGSAAALAAARRGASVVLLDAATFPRDKTCGDGLTPRAMHALEQLGVADRIGSGYRNKGLRLHGFGGSVTCPWPDSAFGTQGSAMRRMDFDALLFAEASKAPGVRVLVGAPASQPELRDGRLVALRAGEHRVKCRAAIVADGVRSSFGKLLGRRWHRDQVYGIAARAYATSPRHAEPWIHSHLELRDWAAGTPGGKKPPLQPGYGWVFPLGDGQVNIGCGALSTAARPAKVNTKKLLVSYAAQVDRLRGGGEAPWALGALEGVSSALLPMGGAVTGVAGANWALIGDAAACVNPLNGEGIDYGLETAQAAVDLLVELGHIGRERAHPIALTHAWPQELSDRYGRAFGLARWVARLLTLPYFLPAAGPVALGSPVAQAVMPVAARLMGNVVTEQDTDAVARLWRAGGASLQWAAGQGLWGAGVSAGPWK